MTYMNFEPRTHRLSDLMGRVIDMDLTELWMKGIKGVLSLLILTILIALTGRVIKTFMDIRLLFGAAVEVGLCQIIVDTILVVMLTEIISLWFKEADQGKCMPMNLLHCNREGGRGEN